MHNVPGKLSHYEGIMPFEQFRYLPYFAEVRADLRDVSVSVLYLVRPRSPQKWPDHYRFWEQYFLAQGSAVESIEPIYGAP
jgi:hypothetical protein